MTTNSAPAAPAPTRPRLTEDRARLLSLAWVVAIAALSYARTASFEFTYDDQTHIVQNPLVRDLDNVDRMLPWNYFEGAAFPDQARPVYVISQFVDLAIGGSAPTGYHLHSVFWHAMTALLVFFFGERLGLSRVTATIGATLFALYPGNAEAVACISNREDVLTTFFSLAALLVARRAFTSGRLLWLLPMGMLHLLALGAKEMATIVPLCLGLLIICTPSWRPAAAIRWRAYGLALAVLTATTLCFGVFQLELGYPGLLTGAGGTGLATAEVEDAPDQPEPRAPTPRGGSAAAPASATAAPPPPAAVDRRPHGEVPLAAGFGLESFRAFQLIAGWPMSAEYDLRPFKQPWTFWAGGFVVALLIALGIGSFFRRPMISFGIFWFLVTTLPVAFPPLLINPLADRHLYMPASGTCLAIAWFMLDWPASRAFRHARSIGQVAAVALVGLYVILGSQRVDIWQNDITLFTDAVRKAPVSARMHQNLGVAHLKAGHGREAETALKRAIELDPMMLAARYNLGRLASVEGRSADAVRIYQDALKTPYVVAEEALRDRLLGRLAQILMRQRRYDDLGAVVDAELRIRPHAHVALELHERLERVRAGID